MPEHRPAGGIPAEFASIPIRQRCFPGAVLRAPAGFAAGERDGVAPGAETALAQAAATPGSSLPTTLRSELGAVLGADLSAVRIHASEASSAAARALGARAFATGTDIHFAAGLYQPDSTDGRQLIAHEVVHTLQTRDRAPGAGGETLRMSSPTDACEREAVKVAGAVGSGVPRGLRIEATREPAHVRRDVDRQKLEANRVATELRTVIAGATWKEIRKRVYPKESAAGIVRAQERHKGTRADLTGVGRLAALSSFVGRIRTIQKLWPSIKPDRRKQEVGNAAGTELEAADVPRFLRLGAEPMEFKGFFSGAEWAFVISKALVEGDTLGDEDAAEVANTALHESRHAEQAFLAARFAAGRPKMDAAAIHAEQGIPTPIAAKAVAKKFDAKTDPRVAALGAQMYQAGVTDRDANQRISDDDGRAEMAKGRLRAQQALRNLERSATAETIGEGKQACDELRKQITVVEQRYSLYRAIPYEADAHEVGDAAEQAFRGWPGAATPQQPAPADAGIR